VLVKAKPATALNNTTATQHESTHLINPNSTVIATGIIYITELQNEPNVALQRPEKFFWVICSEYLGL